MLIAIDGNEANVEKRVGVSVYTYELLSYFHSQASSEARFVVYLRDDSRNDLPKSTEFFKYEVVNSPGLWRDIFLPLKLYSSKRPNIFFSPAHYTPRFCPVPIVVTIHDVAYEYYPNEFLPKDLYKLKNWTAHAVNQTKKIIAVSDNTKKDIVKFYKVSENKINVIYNGYRNSQETNSKKQTSSKFHPPVGGPSSKYILYVGTIQPRKNLNTLIEAFAQFIKDKPDYKLVIAGKKGWKYENIFQMVADLHLSHNIIFTGFVSNLELIQLYQKAECFVMPSLYEGFGIPVLEAMSYGCPVIASNTSSLPEVGGDACLYFDPHDKIDLRNKISQIVDDNRLREDLVKKGNARVKQFSWEKCGRETLSVLQNVASNRAI